MFKNQLPRVVFVGTSRSIFPTFSCIAVASYYVDRGPSFGLPPVWATKMNPPKESLFESLERRKLGPVRYARFLLLFMTLGKLVVDTAIFIHTDR